MWEHDWIEDRSNGQTVTRRRPLGLKMAEALARCPPADAEERAALVEAFIAIEQGAVAGACSGVESLDDRRREEGG